MRPPIIRASLDGLIVDSFAGGGGASTGIEAALGRSVDIAINHDPEAIAMHQANHPNTRHFCESVWDVDPREATGGRPVALAWFSPDCFPAGTLVLASGGYRPIEALREGDVVLTHRNRWRRVSAVMSATKFTLTVRGHGHPGLRVSAEHPFLTRSRSTTRFYRSYSESEWTNACDLAGRYWSTPTRFEWLPAPPIGGRGFPIDERLWWLVGRYLADGWTRLDENRAELVICCGPKKADVTRERLAKWPRAGERSGGGELAWSERTTATEVQFSTAHRGLVAWLRDHFGHLAHLKLIPGWALGQTAPERRALLDGYVSGDGWDRGDLVESTTVSRALAFGLKSLVASLGLVPVVYEATNSNVIEGRAVEVRTIYKVKWRHQVDEKHAQHFHDDEAWHLFTPIRKVVDSGTPSERVHNISVEGDESYVVEGVVVHNCKHFSRAKGAKPVEKKIRGLAWSVTRWARAVRPRIILLENVAEFETWGPLNADGLPCPIRRGRTFRAWVSQLRNLGYQVEWRSLRACDYGAPTSRKRLYLIARCDGEPIVWPAVSHGPGLERPWRVAAECIEWALACPSIFERTRPLADATLRRIAEGMQRYVIDCPQPFIVGVGGRMGQSPARGVDRPYQTITAKLDAALAIPTLVQTGYGEREGQTPRVPGLDKPLGTLVAAVDHHSLVTAALGADRRPEVLAFLTKYYRTSAPTAPMLPFDTVTTRDRFGLVMVDRVEYAISDIGLRMLVPRELYRAQGFPESYVIDPGGLTKTAQTRMVGNSVCPPVADAIVRANVGVAREREAA